MELGWVGVTKGLVLKFWPRQVRNRFNGEKAVFLEGDIQVDLILGYPWLRRTQLGILPHKGTLFHEQSGRALRLLRTVKKSTHVSTDNENPARQQVNVRGVQETPQFEDL